MHHTKSTSISGREMPYKVNHHWKDSLSQFRQFRFVAPVHARGKPTLAGMSVDSWCQRPGSAISGRPSISPMAVTPPPSSLRTIITGEVDALVCSTFWPR
jgi:hypothetical protein